MAAPNWAAASGLNVEFKSNNVALSTTSATVVLNNAASSGLSLKVVSLRATNEDGTNPCEITLTRNSADDGAGTAYDLASTIDVPADTAIDLITEDTPVALEEDSSLVATAENANDIVITVSYWEVSNV